MTVFKTSALAKAKTRQKRLDDAEAKATAAATERDAAVLVAQESGATYAEIQEATGLSTARVTQVLRRQRERRDERDRLAHP